MKKKFYLIAMFIVFGMAINAQYKAKDDFESYAEGDINTLGNTANGWVSSWGVLKGDFKVIAGTPTGKALKASGIIKSDDGNVTFNYSDATAFRDLDSLYPGNAKNGVYWVGFNITFNSFITSDDIKNGAAGNTTYWPTNGWAGLSLYKGDKELLFMGKPGDNNDGVGMGPKSPYSDPAKLSYWVVVRIENRWADSLRDYLDPKVCLWLDPIERGVMNSNEPDTAQADQVAAKAELRGGFNRIRIASASEFSLTYDNIRVGRSFAAVNYQTVMTEPTLPDLIIQNKIIGSALPPKAFDTFDSYTEGATLADLGDANTNGWLKAWEADGSGFAVADLNIDSTAGKHVEMAGYTGVNKNFRTFAKNSKMQLIGVTGLDLNFSIYSILIRLLPEVTGLVLVCSIITMNYYLWVTQMAVRL